MASIAPTEPGDHAVWYLELLESQLKIVDSTLSQLDSFQKSIQIQVKGSVSSAADIKAACLNLASRTKQTSDEVANLHNLCSLIKHDVTQLSPESNELAHL